jgi:hypothetical protein
MVKTEKLIVTTSSLFSADINLNNAVSQDYNIKFAGRPVSAAGKNLSLLAQDAQSGGTNLNGGTVIISGGISTGTGASSILFKTSKAGSSGTTDNTPSTKLTITGTGVFPVFLSASSNPTTSDIPTGTASVFKNTTTGDVGVFINDAGTIKPLTPAASNSSSDYWLSAKITYNAAGDGTSNDAPELTSAFSQDNTIVYLPVGNYLVTSTISISNVSNLKIIGSKNSTILSNTIKTLLSLTNCTNVEIIDVIFSSTVSDTSTTFDTTNGLLKVNGSANLKISSCTFKAANALTNAVKLTVDDTHKITDLRISKCDFNGIGQRGIEVTSSAFVNKNFTDSYIEENSFNNIGVKTAANGQAIFIKAFSTRLYVDDNDITDASGSGIECDGIDGLSLTGNRMYSVNRGFQPIKISNAVTGKTTTSLELTGSNVKVSGTESCVISLQNIAQFNISSNKFNAGTIQVKGTDGSFINNTIFSTDSRALYIQSTSDKLYCHGNYLNNANAPTPLEPVLADGSGVSNIRFIDNSWYSIGITQGFSFTSGSSNMIWVNVWE